MIAVPMEHGPLMINMMIYLLRIVFFRSYVKLPEGMSMCCCFLTLSTVVTVSQAKFPNGRTNIPSCAVC